ncbi:MAG: 30S ribosomal protein S24e [Candidatus Bathyarchaeota archaeon]|nr:30S ribosomal protein S24e [Candidatus Bathyarchaeota archaeon]MCX8176812.1 30S ribosomal protein S24e [Candidatus Bathyarchaeota archaeon]MDW8193341.1 30S ribosomal protein S24e [Nitrososphaerota archaeon]
MKLKILSKKENPLLKRVEVTFQAVHDQAGGTPSRVEIREAIAKELGKDSDLVFVKKVETKTGTQTAIGTAHIYDNMDQARRIEPEHIIKRNIPEKQEKGAEQ